MGLRAPPCAASHAGHRSLGLPWGAHICPCALGGIQHRSGKGRNAQSEMFSLVWIVLSWIVLSCCFAACINHICGLGGCALCEQVCRSVIHAPVSWSWSLVNLHERNCTRRSLSPQPHLAPRTRPPPPLGGGQLLLKTWGATVSQGSGCQKTMLPPGSVSPRHRELFRGPQMPLCWLARPSDTWNSGQASGPPRADSQGIPCPPES